MDDLTKMIDEENPNRYKSFILPTLKKLSIRCPTRKKTLIKLATVRHSREHTHLDKALFWSRRTYMTQPT